MPPVISSLTNEPADGINLRATLAAAPTGTLSFEFRREPTDDWQAVADVSPVSSTVFDVALRTSATVLRYPYFVRAKDTVTGISAPAGEWLCYGTNEDWPSQTEVALHDILLNNKMMLDRAMRIYMGGNEFPNDRPIEVARIVRGVPTLENDGKYPTIALRIHSGQQELYFANPYGDRVPLSGTINCHLIHQTKIRWEGLIRSLAMGVLNTLNQGHYLEFEIPCGLLLQECYCQAFTVQEVEFKDGWVAWAEIPWSGKLCVIKDV